ncbi:hypothetical protein BKA70DRAFT_1433549 [Coprinopsis sp. MPI-PUGE-AT-0042]|nr:hypothetical protein BKA70DRAFT_1433549 [Coprinopsis sp. MPI-PUGE-AT-0042]
MKSSTNNGNSFSGLEGTVLTMLSWYSVPSLSLPLPTPNAAKTFHPSYVEWGITECEVINGPSTQAAKSKDLSLRPSLRTQIYYGWLRRNLTIRHLKKDRLRKRWFCDSTVATRFVSTNELRSRDSHTPAADQATMKIRLLVDSIPGKSLGARPKVQRSVQRPAQPELPLKQNPGTTRILTTSSADVLEGF